MALKILIVSVPNFAASLECSSLVYVYLFVFASKVRPYTRVTIRITKHHSSLFIVNFKNIPLESSYFLIFIQLSIYRNKC